MKKQKRIFLLSIAVVSLMFFNGSVKKAFAGACIDNGGSCWAVDPCSGNLNPTTHKDLVSVPAGDDACAAVYEAPVKCCKDGTTSSSTTPAPPKGGDNGGGSATSFVNPLKFNTVEDFLSNILSVIQKIIVTLSLVMIAIGAVQYVVAGVSSSMDAAKKTIMAALVGLAIGIAAPSLLKELSNVLGWGSSNNATVDSAPTLSVILTRILDFLLGTMGIVALIMLVIGAIMYLTSAGDDKQVTTGKNIFKYSLLGLVVAMSSMMLVTQIAKFFVAQ